VTDASTAYLAGHDEEAFALWAQAHGACVEASDLAGAIRQAFWLACALLFQGDVPRAGGWSERARRSLSDTDADIVERGHVEYLNAMRAIFEFGDVGSAHVSFSDAERIADRFNDLELATLARIGGGRCLIFTGEIAEGLSLLDEAMVAVEAQEISPIVIGDAYCTVIDACTELFDIRRCATWTASFQRWCDANPDVRMYRGHCALRRADVLCHAAEWSEAIAEIEDACARLTDPLHPLALGPAWRLRGDLYRLTGDFSAAEDAYARANDLGCQPQPGLTLLRSQQGKHDAAAATARRLLAETEDPQGRARVLEACVQALLAVGDADAARTAAEQLADVADEFGSDFLQACADRAAGSVALADDRPRDALSPLRRAQKNWDDLGAPYESARTRELLAAACHAVGDDEGAALEMAAVNSADAALGMTVRVNTRRDGLTARELEVITLVAAGMSNRAIARELFISEKTVASHLNHVFTKLGLESRAALTAYAYENRLV
jgi:DNA-binding CsgD family transcriptional regulator